MTDMPYDAKRGGLRRARIPFAPGLVIALTLIVLVAMAQMTLTVPIGPMYWDLIIYIDGAYRVLDGQIPNVDFFPPVGALAYWLYAGAMKLFPSGHPLLLADWSLLVITAPLMALVAAEVDRTSRIAAFALVLPFLFFSVLSFNTEFSYFYAGFEGFGIYNRQGDRLLYVLAAALVFCRDTRRMTVVIAGTMLSLFLLKITGFLAGGILCAYGVLAGRIPLRVVVVSIAFCLVTLLGLEAWLGVVGAYLNDIATLVAMNNDVLLSRFLQAASIQFSVVAPAAILILTLLAFRARSLIGEGRAFARGPSLAGVGRFFDKDVFAIGATAFAALFYETQNSGGQAFIFLWPALLALILQIDRWTGWRRVLIVTLIAATAMPSFINVAGRAGRAIVGQLRYDDLESRNLKTLGLVTQRPEILKRAATMLDFYPRYASAFEFLEDKGELPGFTIYSEPDFHLTQLMAFDQVVDAIRLYEMAENVHFDTMMTLNFTNPMPWLMDRHATKYIPIGADPWRTVPEPTGRVAEAVHNTDLVLYPKCPLTTANRNLLSIYAPFLTDHRRISLTPCFDAFVRNGIQKVS